MHFTFTVNSYGTICIFTDVHELGDYGIVRCAPINKEQVVVVKTHICEPFGIVHFFVQAYDSGDVVLPEIWEVGLRSMERITCKISKPNFYNMQLIHNNLPLLSTKVRLSKLPFSILLFGCGPLKAKNFPGIIQLKSPFSALCGTKLNYIHFKEMCKVFFTHFQYN